MRRKGGKNVTVHLALSMYLPDERKGERLLLLWLLSWNTIFH